jgi:hypothetical protein
METIMDSVPPISNLPFILLFADRFSQCLIYSTLRRSSLMLIFRYQSQSENPIQNDPAAPSADEVQKRLGLEWIAC